MKIYLDFDGTVVEHEYPKIGRCNFGCIQIIDKLQKTGHEIILNTMRSDFNNGTLEEALEWFNNAWMWMRDKDFSLKPITSTVKKIHPIWDWGYFEQEGLIFIDDQAVGIPLKPTCMNNGLMVDWGKLDIVFKEKKIY